MRRRVVVTGLGCLTPVGNDVTTTWNNLLNGVSGVDYITHFDASTFPSKIAGEVKQFDPTALPVDKKLLDYAGRVSQLGIAAALMAVEDANLAIEKLDLTRVGSSVGASGEYPDIEQLSYYHRFKGDGGWDYKAFADSAHIPSTWVFRRSSHTVSLIMAKLFKFLGPNMTTHTACASGSYAIGQAFRVIERGDAEVMITGGTDAISSPLWVAAFGLLGALSTRQIEPQKASRPFDAMRDGFVIGEGAGMLILEELSFALHRGAKIYAEIVGYGTSANATRITDSPQDGFAPRLAMKRAIDDAGIATNDIQYVNAHGTSTQQNDKSETAALKGLFGDHAYKVPVSSIKSMVGHLISGIGAVALLSTIFTVKEGLIPPTINYEYPDPDCDLDYVPNKMRRKDVNYALANAFGFGGQNSSIVVKKFTN